MIPRHRPPFSVTSLLMSAGRAIRNRPQIECVEHAYCEALDVQHAVWIPSARYGIARSLQFGLPEKGTIACGAFNCGAVFHALSSLESRQSAEVQTTFVDCAADSFLMDVDGVTADAVVLSEIFGHRFGDDDANSASMRIWDMAMCDPTVGDLQRLPADSHDVALLSFGLSKPLYAGGGGLVLTRSADMAARLREQRNHDLSQVSSKANLKMLARTLAHDQRLYQFARRQQRSGSPSFSTSSAEWQSAPTRWQLQRSLDNLKNSAAARLNRRRLVNKWRARLEPVGLPVTHQFHDSHLSVRVPAQQRNAVLESLRQQGIDAGKLFPFHAEFSPTDFPQAHAASAEVINLPLHDRVVMPSEIDLPPHAAVGVELASRRHAA